MACVVVPFAGASIASRAPVVAREVFMVRFVARRPVLAFALATIVACVVIGPVRVGHAYGHVASVAVSYLTGFARGVWGGI